MSATTPRSSQRARASRHELEHAIGRLVTVATRSDDVGELLALASATLRRAMAVVDAHGVALAIAAEDVVVRDALALALGDLDGGPPAGFEPLPLRLRHEALGFLLLRADPPLAGAEQPLLDAARSLLADQLRRLALTAGVLEERRGAVKRRIVGDGRSTRAELRAAGEHARMALADYYWPAVVTWEPRERDVPLLPDVERLLQRHAPAHVAVRADARTLVLLLAQRDASDEHALEARLIVEQVVPLVRTALPGARVHGVLATGAVGLDDVAARVARLRWLARYLERRQAPVAGVCSERGLALLDLLHGVDHARAAAFAGGELAPLLAYDRAHGTHLADVLELALDLPNRADAARAAYMHRNTFRRHLNHALELLGGDLADPDERLAVHVALKLVRAAPRGLTASGGRSETPVRARATDPDARVRSSGGG